MANLEASGRLHTKMEAVQITERFRKREFVVEMGVDSQYPQTVLFQLTGDRCEKLDDIEVGTDVDIEFSLRGREWTSPKGETRFFNSLEAWAVRAGEVHPTLDDAVKKAEEKGLDDPSRPSGDDDIPF